MSKPDGAVRRLLAAVVLATAAGCTCQQTTPTPAAPAAPPTASGPASGPAAAPTPASAPGRLPGSTPLTACRTDRDCVAVAADCCGCEHGGARGVVAREHHQKFEAARRARCVEMVCVTMMSTHPSCSLVPRCVTGSCRLVPPPGDAGASRPGPMSEPPSAAPQ